MIGKADTGRKAQGAGVKTSSIAFCVGFSSLFASTVKSPAAEAASSASGTGGFSLLAGFFQMAASLAVVVGVILLFHYISRKWLKGGMSPGSRNAYIRVVENRFVAPKKSLMLVEVGGEYMLLGNSAEGITLIKQIEMIENIEIVGEASAVPFRDALQEKLKNLAGRLPVGFEGLAASLKKAEARR